MISDRNLAKAVLRTFAFTTVQLADEEKAAVASIKAEDIVFGTNKELYLAYVDLMKEVKAEFEAELAGNAVYNGGASRLNPDTQPATPPEGNWEREAYNSDNWD